MSRKVNVNRNSQCEICGFCLTHRHHIADYVAYGESNDCLYICPNCHEVLHACVGSIVFNRKKASQTWDALSKSLNKNYIDKILGVVYDAAELIVDREIRNYD